MAADIWRVTTAASQRASAAVATRGAAAEMRSCFYRGRALRGYFWLAAVLILVPAAALTVVPSVPVVIRVGAGLVGVRFGYLTLVRWPRTIGVATGSDGIWFSRGSRVKFIPWSEIRAFRIARPAISPPAHAELWSGKLVALPVLQGRQVVWQDGATRDIVGLLNEELSKRRPDIPETRKECS